MFYTVEWFSWYSYIIRMFSYVIQMYTDITRMLLVCTCMSSICHLYILVCHSHVPRMYLYVIRMTLVYNRMSAVCHLHVMYSDVTSKYSFVICMSLVCDFTINQIKYKLTRKCFSLVSLELLHIKSGTLKVCPNGIIVYRKKVI